jgi:FkbM family methyltransferase
MTIESLRRGVKGGLAPHPALFRVAQRIYHELRFLSAYLVLRLRYPRLRIVRYSEQELRSLRTRGFRSQFGQDHFVFTEFFSDRAPGCFFDVGCSRPEYLNNTFFFEQQLNWNGIAVDPIEGHQFDWTAQRRARFLPIALGANEETKAFVEISNKNGWAGMLSSFGGYVRKEDLAHGHRSYQVSVRRASDVLDECGVSSVDLMSLDVEGAELDVLSGLDMNRHTPRVLLVENTRGLTGRSEIRRYLRRRGYRFYARIWTTDDVFVRDVNQ